MEYDGLLLASGGMDSTVLAYDLERKGQNLLILFLDYGQHCMKKELETLRRVMPDRYKNNVNVIKIGDIYKGSDSRMIKEANLWEEDVEDKDLYLPYRNLLFLSIAAACAQSKGIKIVYSAFINSNHAKEIDCSIDFFNKLDSLLVEFGSVKIVMPFKEMSKTDVLRLGLEIKAPVAFTYSCQAKSQNPCGACPNCVERINAENNLTKEDKLL